MLETRKVQPVSSPESGWQGRLDPQGGFSAERPGVQRCCAPVFTTRLSFLPSLNAAAPLPTQPARPSHLLPPARLFVTDVGRVIRPPPCVFATAGVTGRTVLLMTLGAPRARSGGGFDDVRYPQSFETSPRAAIDVRGQINVSHALGSHGNGADCEDRSVTEAWRWSDRQRRVIHDTC